MSTSTDDLAAESDCHFQAAAIVRLPATRKRAKATMTAITARRALVRRGGASMIGGRVVNSIVWGAPGATPISSARRAGRLSLPQESPKSLYRGIQAPAAA